MKTVFRTYKFRMYPNAEQRPVLARYFGSVRFIYNHYLAERKRQYEEAGRSDNYVKQAKDLVALKRSEGLEWLKEINSQTLQQTLMHLDVAYKNFFNHTADFPKFKSRKRGGSFTVPQFCYIENGYVHIPKFKEGLKVKEHRKVKAATLDVAAPEVYIYATTCGDLSITGCNGMKDLWMSLDRGGNVSVSQCASLQTLCIGWNITGLSVTGCGALRSFTARECNMSSFQASSLPSLTELDIYNNKNLTGLMLPVFDEVRARPGSSLSYDQRYWYDSDGTWRDEGYGYWYDGEPDRGYHLR